MTEYPYIETLKGVGAGAVVFAVLLWQLFMRGTITTQLPPRDVPTGYWTCHHCGKRCKHLEAKYCPTCGTLAQ